MITLAAATSTSSAKVLESNKQDDAPHEHYR
jgi:hypothetical protein